jgi:hypothetical protein
MRGLCHYTPRALTNGSATAAMLQTLPTAARIPAVRSCHRVDAMPATHLHWLHHETVLPLYELMDS